MCIDASVVDDGSEVQLFLFEQRVDGGGCRRDAGIGGHDQAKKTIAWSCAVCTLPQSYQLNLTTAVVLYVVRVRTQAENSPLPHTGSSRSLLRRDGGMEGCLPDPEPPHGFGMGDSICISV